MEFQDKDLRLHNTEDEMFQNCKHNGRRVGKQTFAARLVSAAFLIFGFLCLIGFWSNEKAFIILRSWLGVGALTIIPVSFLVSYLISKRLVKGAFWSLLLIPAISIIAPFLGLNGGKGGTLFRKLSLLALDHIFMIAFCLACALILHIFRNRIFNKVCLTGILNALRQAIRLIKQSVIGVLNPLNNPKAVTDTNDDEKTPSPSADQDIQEGLRTRIMKYESRYIGNLNNIRGYNNLVKRLKNDIDGYILERAKAKQYIGETSVKSFLLYGPGGTGKSFFARSFAGYLSQQYGFIVFDVKNWQQLAGSGWQQSMKALMEFLDLIQDCRLQGVKICIIWDEFDGFIGGEMPSDTKRIAAVKAAFDDWHAQKATAPLLFFATTNDPQEFSEEMLRPGRLQPVFFPPPDSEARKAIIQGHLKDRKLKISERDRIIDWIATNSNNATVSELISYMDNVCGMVYEKARKQKEDLPIMFEDFQRAAMNIKDYDVFLQKMKKKFNHKHRHKLGIFGEMEQLVEIG
jgi:energy-coupling factor transporter ATP-binding protein EcfA2